MVLCFGLSGLAVGFGARLPNLRKTSPSKIATGFGDKLNLAASTGFILITVLISLIPAYFWVYQQTAHSFHSRWLQWFFEVMGFGSLHAIVVSTAIVVLLGTLTTRVPMQAEIKSFRRL